MTLREIAPVVEAFMLGSLAAALAALAWAMDGRYFLPALAIVFAHTLFLAVPLYALLRWKQRISAATTIGGAFLIGCTPMAIWSWPLAYRELRGNVMDSRWGEIMVNGVPTTAGWLAYASGVLIFGAFGLLAGLVFWFYLRFRGR